jgi:hypothetical protein
MKKQFVALAFLFLLQVFPVWGQTDFWRPIVGMESQKILVPGPKPLTVGKQNTLFNCIEFALSCALTQGEEESLRAGLMQEFLTFKEALLEDLQELETLWTTILESAPEDRSRYRLLLRDALLKETTRNSINGIGKILSAIEKQSQEAVVPGNPLISKRQIAAYFELVQMALRLRDRRVVSWNAAELATLEQELITGIPRLTPEGRKWLANADLHRAITAKNWNKTSAEEKETIRVLLVETYAPAGSKTGTMPVDIQAIHLPPPNLFPLPRELPWNQR